MEQQSALLVNRDMTLGEIVQRFPEAIDIIQGRGLHCVGCGAAYWETLAEGAMGHGWTQEELNSMITEINVEVAKRPQGGTHMEDQEMESGGCGSGSSSGGGCGSSGGGCGSSAPQQNVVMPKMTKTISGPVLTLTAKAAEKAQEFMKAEGVVNYGLKVAVIPGGCAGYSYDLGFAEKAEANDIVLEQQGIKIFVDKDSAQYLEGTTLDFVEGLQGTGFKFSNPNAKSSCGCGSSFG